MRKSSESTLDVLGDRQSFYVFGKVCAGRCHHVSIRLSFDRKVLFAVSSANMAAPMTVCRAAA